MKQSVGLVCWALYDWANTSFSTVVQTFLFATYFTEHLAPSSTDGTVWWAAMTAVAGLTVAVAGPVLGSIADRAGRRKPWIAGFTILCCTATAALWFVRPSPHFAVPGLALVGIGIVGLEMANVFYNAILGDLAPCERVGRSSGRALAAGYLGGLACMATALLLFVDDDPWRPLERATFRHVRASCVLVAVWFATFSAPMFLFTPDTPRRSSTGRAVREGWETLRQKWREVGRDRDLVRFLVAWMLSANGLSTLFAFGGVYAAGTFGLGPSETLRLAIGLNVAAAIGASVFG